MPHVDADQDIVDSIRIRPAARSDAESLARLELASALAGYAHIFPDAMPKPTRAGLEKRWAEFLADPDMTVLIAAISEEPVGFVLYGAGREAAVAGGELRKLYVIPAQMGRGIGSLLHDRAVDGLCAAGFTTAQLWVLERNIVARRMYVRRGWNLRRMSKSPWPGSGILELCYTRELPTRL